jgi:serine/threonine protein kinase
MKYTLVEKIGEGGFGIVEKVKDSKGQLFARKTFHINNPLQFDRSARDNLKKRFIRETKIQYQISHRNIVRVIEANLDADPPYYIMPLAEGTLADDWENDKSLNGNYMAALMDILAGLEALHNMGFNHRDLKPSNVLSFLDQGGEKYYAIGDFGLASVAQMSNITTLTQTGTMMRSDMYTAPEITTNLRFASIQSDIYSVGCILHDFVGLAPRIPCAEIKERNNPYATILQVCTRLEVVRRFKSVSDLREALLELGQRRIPPQTEKGKRVFSLLTADGSLNEEDWRLIVEFVEDQYPSEDSENALKKLTLEKIETLTTLNKDFMDRLGLIYAKWIREGSFSFSDCDGLAIRIEKFFVKSERIDVKAECIMAILYMGTNHNRYFVEKKFIGLLNKVSDRNLIDRLSVEIRADGEKACAAFQHLSRSISYDLRNLPTEFASILKKLCR